MIRVYCIDDHPVVLRGLIEDLRDDTSISVVGTATDPLVGISEIESKAHSIDVVITDIEMPGLNGYDLCSRIKATSNTKVILFTYLNSAEVVFKAQRAHADGLLFKQADGREILQNIHNIVKGPNTFIFQKPATITRKPLNDVLTESEKQIVRLIAGECLSSAQIAERLHRSKYTIDTHRKNIMAKLRVRNVAELLHYATYSGLLDTGSPTNDT